MAEKLRFKNANGENYPDWKDRLLGNITKINTGKKELKDNDSDGKYPFFVRSANIERINSYSFDGEAILIPGDGKIGEVFHYINGKFDFHQRVYKISGFKEIKGKFIYYYLQKKFLKHAMMYSAKATVDSLRLPIIKEMEISVPCLEEQEKLANFLTNIDKNLDQISLELKYMTEFKKGLLQQMLIYIIIEFINILLNNKN